MDLNEIQASLNAIKDEVKSGNSNNKAEFEQKMAGLNAEIGKLSSKEEVAEVKKMIEAVQKHADGLDIKIQGNQSATSVKAGYYENVTKSITDNFADISKVTKGKAMQIKTVGDMTLGVNLTGAQPKDYNYDVVMIPGQLVNVSDLVGSINISGGTYTYVREGAGEGSIGAQTEGSSKLQKDYDITMVDCNTDFIAGYARYSKKMANNLPFLTSYIPKALQRDYSIAENSSFYTTLAAAATDSPAIITGKNKVEMLIGDIAYQQGLNYNVNAIVVTPADYYNILVTEKSTGAGYGLPGIVSHEGGALRINGIPVYKATWVAANKYFVGDWSRITKVVTEGLSLEFSEHEGTNFVKNNITARIESQTALAVEQPLAILLGDFTATT